MLVSSDSAFLQALGQRIRALRKEKGWSQQDLAYRIGMEKSNLSVIENGKSNPQILTLVRIACTLEVQPLELLQFELEIPQFIEARGAYLPRKHRR
jgi:transcriptional regulator with XRE-family HTH domain